MNFARGVHPMSLLIRTPSTMIRRRLAEDGKSTPASQVGFVKILPVNRTAFPRSQARKSRTCQEDTPLGCPAAKGHRARRFAKNARTPLKTSASLLKKCGGSRREGRLPRRDREFREGPVSSDS
jgi:hypothetical protein